MNSCFLGALVIVALTVLAAPARASETRQDAPPPSQNTTNDRGAVKPAAAPRSGKASVKEDAANRAKLLKELGGEGASAISSVFGGSPEPARSRSDDPRTPSSTAPVRPTYKAEIVQVAAHDERGYLVRSSLDLQVEQKLPAFAACFTAAMQRGELTMDYGWTDWSIALRRDGTLQPSGSSNGDRSPVMLACFLAVLPRLMSKADVERILVPHDRPFREMPMNVKLRFRPIS